MSFVMPRLLPQEQWQTVGLINNGMTTKYVGRDFPCGHSTLVSLSQRFQAISTMDDGPRPGKPCGTTQAQDRQVLLMHLRNSFQTAT